jgi:hypothetical protein
VSSSIICIVRPLRAMVAFIFLLDAVTVCAIFIIVRNPVNSVKRNLCTELYIWKILKKG